jgi:hypothetical protein
MSRTLAQEQGAQHNPITPPPITTICSPPLVM